MKLYEFIKSIVLLLLLVYLVPVLIKNSFYRYNYFLEPRTYIGIITIRGKIHNSSAYIKQLQAFFKNPVIKGIVLKIDCCESPAGTSQILFNEIQQYKKEYPKPIITLIENVCICGAYLIASATDYIVAPEGAIVGGIGSYAAPVQYSLSARLCALPYPVSHSSLENGNASTVYNELSQQFTKHVATARRLSLATIANWANEKIFTGKQAYSLGLVNAIGSMHTVITLLKERALIDGEIEWIEKEKTKPCAFQYPLLQALYNSVIAENQHKV